MRSENSNDSNQKWHLNWNMNQSSGVTERAATFENMFRVLFKLNINLNRCELIKPEKKINAN